MKATYIDHMGDDLRVVNAARVSFNKESEWAEITGVEHKNNLNNQDRRLIKYLAAHSHWTPFSHCMITMREKVPIFVARQRFKHMVGFTYNEVSRRYVSDEPEFFMPQEWRGAPTDGAKQGSSGTLKSDWFNHANKCVNSTCMATYKQMLENGLAPEQARMVLPQSMYTEYYVTGSLYAWARAYNLRIDVHAQKEIQDLAKQWNEIINPLFPYSWEALTSGIQD